MTASTSDMSVSTRSVRFPAMDGLRGLGALFVLTTHVGFHSGASLNSDFRGILSRLDSGVAIFFVLSGFLLSRPYWDAWLSQSTMPSSRTYARNRVLRIIPALWLTIILVALLVSEPGRTWTDLLLHGALLQIYFPGHETLGLTQMWSLATEAAFYVALPFIVLVLRRLKPDRGGILTAVTMLSALPLLSAVWVGWSVSTAPHRSVWLPGHLGWFALGMVMALWVVCRHHGRVGWTGLDDVASHPWTSWGLAAGVYLVLATPVAGPYSLVPAEPWQAVIKSLGYGLFGALMVLPATRIESPSTPRATRALGSSGWRFLGDISYGIFCYHLIVLHLVEQATGHEVFSGGFLRLWVATVVGTLVVAWLSYRFVERPLLRRFRGPTRDVSSTADAMAANANT